MLSSMTAMTLTTLINERLAELGITKHELVVRLRYDNINKGLRRLQSVIGGDLDGLRGHPAQAGRCPSDAPGRGSKSYSGD
jgi:hypothetical protein